MAYTEQDWTAILPAGTKTKLQAMDAGIKTAQDALDLETAAGKAMTQAADVAAQRTLLNVEDGADVTATALAAAIEGGTATVTPLDTSIVPGVRADHSRLYYTWANIFATIWARLGALIAGGTDKATPLDADTIPLSSAADSGATRKLTWANIKAAIVAAFPAASTTVAGKIQLATTGTESATKVPKATGAELAALLTAGGFTLTAPSGANSLDGIADTETWKKVAAAVATALNAGTYDAPKCTAFGIGNGLFFNDVASFGAYADSGRWCYFGPNITGLPTAGYYKAVFTELGGNDQCCLLIKMDKTAPRFYMAGYSGGSWGSWYQLWSSLDNGGQPPQAKSNKTSNATIGWFDVVDCASGASVTLPSGGTFETEVLTYGATYNSVKTAIVAGGAMTGTASANLSMRYKRLTA